jgi:hypothetical protein
MTHNAYRDHETHRPSSKGTEGVHKRPRTEIVCIQHLRATAARAFSVFGYVVIARSARESCPDPSCASNKPACSVKQPNECIEIAMKEVPHEAVLASYPIWDLTMVDHHDIDHLLCYQPHVRTKVCSYLTASAWQVA